MADPNGTKTETRDVADSTANGERSRAGGEAEKRRQAWSSLIALLKILAIAAVIYALWAGFGSFIWLL